MSRRFQQHELETSSRRAPWSIRTPRINKEVPATPAPIPSQMRSWNPTGPPDTGANGLVTDTPWPRHTNHLKDISAKGKSTNAPAGNGAGQRAATLPGFQNSFVTSDPVDVTRKGKERAVVAPGFDPLSAASRAQQPISPIVANGAFLRSPLSSPIRQRTSGDDIAMDDREDHFMFEHDDTQLDARDALPMDEFDEFEKPSLQDEVRSSSFAATGYPSFISIVLSKSPYAQDIWLGPNHFPNAHNGAVSAIIAPATRIFVFVGIISDTRSPSEYRERLYRYSASRSRLAH